MQQDSQTINEILELEHKAFFEAESKYGDFFRNAVDFNNLLDSFLKEASPDAHIFVMFLAQVKKYALLCLLSIVRGHHVQGMLDKRQMLEAGVNASYGLANPIFDDYTIKGKDGILTTPKSLTNKRYRWLEKNYPIPSGFIKKQKDGINESCAHSNIVYVFSNFEMYNKDKPGFSMSFFDKDDEYLVKTDLWSIANTTMGLVDLFYGINLQSNKIKFIDDFIPKLKLLDQKTS